MGAPAAGQNWPSTALASVSAPDITAAAPASRQPSAVKAKRPGAPMSRPRPLSLALWSWAVLRPRSKAVCASRLQADPDTSRRYRVTFNVTAGKPPPATSALKAPRPPRASQVSSGACASGDRLAEPPPAEARRRAPDTVPRRPPSDRVNRRSDDDRLAAARARPAAARPAASAPITGTPCAMRSTAPRSTLSRPDRGPRRSAARPSLPAWMVPAGDQDASRSTGAAPEKTARSAWALAVSGPSRRQRPESIASAASGRTASASISSIRAPPRSAARAATARRAAPWALMRAPAPRSVPLKPRVAWGAWNAPPPLRAEAAWAVSSIATGPSKGAGPPFG